jgi:hypothetical protein
MRRESATSAFCGTFVRQGSAPVSGRPAIYTLLWPIYENALRNPAGRIGHQCILWHICSSGFGTRFWPTCHLHLSAADLRKCPSEPCGVNRPSVRSVAHLHVRVRHPFLANLPSTPFWGREKIRPLVLPLGMCRRKCNRVRSEACWATDPDGVMCRGLRAAGTVELTRVLWGADTVDYRNFVEIRCRSLVSGGSKGRILWIFLLIWQKIRMQ